MLREKLLKCILAFFLAVSISGCADDIKKSVSVNETETKNEEVQSATVDVDRVKELRLVKKGQKTKYLLHNGVEEKPVEKTISVPEKNWEAKVPIPQISGLVNKEIEKKVNQQIMEDVEKGIKKYINGFENVESSHRHIYCMVVLNANNLLSIKVVDFYSPPFMGLLYRLNDGKRLYLKDIFTEGTDSMELVNLKIAEYCAKTESFHPKIIEINDANFVLTGSTLTLGPVDINLSEIDDYVDVLDRYSGVERKTHERQDLIFRSNNIFKDEKSAVIKKENGEVWVRYPEISGLRDNSFEASINNTIKKSIDTVLADEALDSIRPNKGKTGDNENIARIQLYVFFNNYGVLSLERSVIDTEDKLKGYKDTYSFDLIRKKPVDVKEMFLTYILKDPNAKDRFVNLTRESIRKQFAKNNNLSAEEIDEKINYDYIVNNCTIGFRSYPEKVYLGVDFSLESSKDLIKTVNYRIMCDLPLKDIINAAYEDFFGW